MAPFGYSLAFLGISRRQAAIFLDVSENTIDKWARGATHPPDGVWEEMGALYEDIMDGTAELDGVDFTDQARALELMGF